MLQKYDGADLFCTSGKGRGNVICNINSILWLKKKSGMFCVRLVAGKLFTKLTAILPLVSLVYSSLLCVRYSTVYLYM